MGKTIRHKHMRCAVLFIVILTGIFLAGCQGRTGMNQTSIQSDQIRQEAMSPVGSGPVVTKADEMPGRQISWQAQLAVEVDDVEEAMQSIGNICQEQGGYVVNSSFSRKDDRYSGEVTVKVLQEKMEEAADQVGKQGVLLNRTVQGRDVTEEHYDAQARLKVMQAKEERLIALLGQSSSIKDLLEVEKELGLVRTDIETLQGRIRLIENTTAYASIRIILSQTQPAYLKTPSTLSGKAANTLINSINTMMILLGRVVIGFIYLLPWLLVVGIIVLVIRRIRRGKIK